MNWVVGDVHGCVRELEDLLRAISHDPGRDRLWSVGDLVNTGPHSAEALRLWLDAGGLGVVGNHDVYALLLASGDISPRPDRLNGLLSAPDRKELLDTLRSWPALRGLPGPPDSPRAWIVHGGIPPRSGRLESLARKLDHGPHDDRWLRSRGVRFVTRVRCCNALGERTRHVGSPEDCPPPYRPWDAFYEGPELVIHGHWAHRGLYRGARTLGLDSGCVYGGRLSAWCLEDDRIVQVSARDPRGYAHG